MLKARDSRPETLQIHRGIDPTYAIRLETHLDEFTDLRLKDSDQWLKPARNCLKAYRHTRHFCCKR